MAESRSAAADGVVYPAPCNLTLVHYRNSDAANDREIELRDGQNGPVLMKIHTLKSSSGTINIGPPGIRVPTQLYAHLPGGSVAIDIVIDKK